MFIDLFSGSCKEGGGEGGEGFSLLGKIDEPIFREYVLPDQPEFLVTFYELLQLRFTINSFCLAIFEKCMPGNYCYDY